MVFIKPYKLVKPGVKILDPVWSILKEIIILFSESLVTEMAANIQLPKFWPADPQLWFCQAEALFKSSNITSADQKYNLVLASLTPDIMQEVRDIVLSAADLEDPYSSLRAALFERTTESERTRLQKLLAREELGDRSPSQLLRHMKRLWGEQPGSPDIGILKELFLQRLPANIQTVLMVLGDSTPLEKLAETADKMMEVSSPTPAVSSVSSNKDDVISQLQHQVRELTEAVKRLSARGRPRSRSRSRHRKNQDSSGMCFYHSRFGEKSYRCIKPCSFPGNGKPQC